MKAGRLREKVAFDRLIEVQDGIGGIETRWSEPEDAFCCRAQFIYSKGSEVVEAARLQGQATYKIKIRQSAAAREITSDWRMRDVHRGTEYNVIEVDDITDRQWIYLVVQSGVPA